MKSVLTLLLLRLSLCGKLYSLLLYSCTTLVYPTHVVAVGPPVQVVRPEIKEVNGSNMTMGCTRPLSDGNTTCGTRRNGAISYLIDGVSPDINTSNSDWASQLVTVRRSEGSLDIPYPHVLLTFGFDTAVSLTGIEMDLFLCPDWGIGAPPIAVYLNEEYNLATTNIFTLPFVFADNKDSLQSSCDSLSTVTIFGDLFTLENYQTFHILLESLGYPSIEWVYIGEVRFLDSSGSPIAFSGIYYSRLPLPIYQSVGRRSM